MSVLRTFQTGQERRRNQAMIEAETVLLMAVPGVFPSLGIQVAPGIGPTVGKVLVEVHRFTNEGALTVFVATGIEVSNHDRLSSQIVLDKRVDTFQKLALVPDLAHIGNVNSQNGDVVRVHHHTHPAVNAFRQDRTCMGLHGRLREDADTVMGTVWFTGVEGISSFSKSLKQVLAGFWPVLVLS